MMFMFWPVPVVFFVVLIVLILLLSRNLDAGVSSRSGSYIHDNYHTTEVTTDGEQQRGYRLVVAAFTPTLIVARSRKQHHHQHHQVYPHHQFNPNHLQHRYSRKNDDDEDEDKDVDSSVLDDDHQNPNEEDAQFRPLMKLASAHFASQALHAALQLQIPDILAVSKTSPVKTTTHHRSRSDRSKEYYYYSIPELSAALTKKRTSRRNENGPAIPNCNDDALLRTMRLLTTIDIVQEHEREATMKDTTTLTTTTTSAQCFALTKLGRSLVTTNDKPSMASCYLHWLEEPLWDSWMYVADYILPSASATTTPSLPPPTTITTPTPDPTLVMAADTSSINAEKDNDTDSDVDIDIIDDDSNPSDPTTVTTTTTITTTTNPTPFERANPAGLSSDAYYNQQEHPQSLVYANDFVQHVLALEVRSLVTWFSQQYDEEENSNNKNNTNNTNKNQTTTEQQPRRKVLDIGGNNGSLLQAIAQQIPTNKTVFDYYCFDLPEVIARHNKSSNNNGVTMISGNVLEPHSIPTDCHIILMKHFCDRCMWTEHKLSQILRNCAKALVQPPVGTPASSSKATTTGKIIIVDAVVPDHGYKNKKNGRNNSNESSNGDDDDEMALYLDGLYMLVGRERQRTAREWNQLAASADLVVTEIAATNVPTCSILVLEPKK